MPAIPRDKSPDSTLAMLRDPYGFIQTRCRALGTDLFWTRLMLRETICMTGREAAELFYDPEHFTRIGAAPGRIQKTLFGVGGVQGLDGEAHRHRKAMFMALLTDDRVAELAELVAGGLRSAVREWTAKDRIELYGAAREILTRAVCSWSGVPIKEPEVEQRTRELTALFDYAGSIGPKHWWSRLERHRAERWAGEIIERVRADSQAVPEESPVRVIALHQELDGRLLCPRIAAVELLNLLRPTVAVSVFITFAALALHQYPACRHKLVNGESRYAELFAQEVRRFYPFFPSVIALTRRDFEWKGYLFPAGKRVVLDLYGTDHDPRTWDVPEEFRPERFRRWSGCPFSFIPQGGGDPHIHHRCPGEGVAVALIKVAANFLSREITYDVPEQDLRVDRSRLPALPQSRFLISNVREKS